MALANLATAAAESKTVMSILAGPLGHTEAVRQLESFQVYTSERSVRRYRERINWVPNPKPAKTEEPKSEPIPKGWEPFTETIGQIGSAIVRMPRPNSTERDLLVQAGFDPDSWKIKGAVQHRQWMRYDQEWLHYYKFDVEQGESQGSIEAHVEELVARIRKRSQGTKFSYGTGGTYVLVLSDWQIGKAEGGKGSADTVSRWLDCLAQTTSNIIALRKMGANLSNLAILSVGDLVEGCGDHYDMQTFSVDLDRRSQNRTVREMLTQTLLTLVPMFDHTTVAVVGGNHGENRRKGKAYTTFADNDDVGCPEAVKEAFDLAGWDIIEWHIPNEELSMCVELDSVKVGLVHGHQFKGGTNALKKAEDWWRANVFGLEPVNEAQILLSGHFHHYCAVNVTAGRTWIQGPTIDPGSQWHTDRTGVTSTPGVLTFVIDPGHPFGYDHLRVLAPSDDYYN